MLKKDFKQDLKMCEKEFIPSVPRIEAFSDGMFATIVRILVFAPIMFFIPLRIYLREMESCH